ncbi:MAG: SPOR domain-containing protein [Pyrinomonadaceae bacterium]
MRRILISAFLTCLFICPTLYAQNSSTRPGQLTPSKGTIANKAQSGFYLEIKRSYIRAYPGWQKKTIALLKPKGFKAFNGEATNQTTADNLSRMESLEKHVKPRLLISSVYVGPYESREAAERMIPRLLSALKALIDREKKNDGLHNRYLF